MLLPLKQGKKALVSLRFRKILLLILVYLHTESSRGLTQNLRHGRKLNSEDMITKFLFVLFDKVSLFIPAGLKHTLYRRLASVLQRSSYCITSSDEIKTFATTSSRRWILSYFGVLWGLKHFSNESRFQVPFILIYNFKKISSFSFLHQELNFL